MASETEVGAPVTTGTAVSYGSAKALACVIVGLVTLLGIFVPPALPWDPATGMLAWRTLENGGSFNSIAEPDPADISKDQFRFLSWWSPGQYLIPGAFTLLGLRLGSALTLTTALSLLCCLLGWIRVIKHFALGPGTAMLVVVFLSTFRYSTISFYAYSGGEILLQAVTPWLLLAACAVPAAPAIRAACFAGLAVLIGFFAKLTGVIVAAACLTAASAAGYQRFRRISSGMIGGAIGATLAFGFLSVTWFSHGITPASGYGWGFPGKAVFFAFSAPWGAAISWQDLLDLTFHLRSRMEPLPPAIMLLFLLPACVFGITILFAWRRCAGNVQLRALLTMTVCVYVISALSLAMIYAHGGSVSIDERHLRSAGTLILVCVIALAIASPNKAPGPSIALPLCGLMSIAGVAFMVRDARWARHLPIDSYSRVRQDGTDIRAIQFVTAAFARDGQDDIFVLEDAGVGSAFPPSARILFADFLSRPQSSFATKRYAGRLRGSVYIVIQTATAESPKGPSLLKLFTDYPAGAWETHQFGGTTVFAQVAPDAANRRAASLYVGR